MIASNPFIPYCLADERPKLKPMNGKSLLVHIAINLEYWPFDRPMPRGIIPAPHGAPPIPPDIPNYGWVEYGMRCGMPRMMDIIADRKIKASAFMNAMVVDVYPSLSDRVLTEGYEIVGHGMFQQTLKQADDEAKVISETVTKLEAFSGQNIRAWLGPGLAETENSLELFRQNGIEFVHDWIVDDLPAWIKAGVDHIVALPYSLELNDVPVYVIQNASSDELYKRVEASLSIFDAEIKTKNDCRILTIGLHPHIIGVPHRAYYFEQILDLLLQRSDTIFVTSSQIGEWFLSQAKIQD
jgi:allantoinase